MPSFRQKLTSLVTRRYPFYSGCGSISNSKVVNFLSGSRSGSVWSRVPGGEVFADLSDYVGKSAFYVGDLDRKITWVCKQIVREGDTVLDIGANIGVVTVLLSDLVGLNGVVHSFEPNPELSELLKKTIDHNEIGNVTLHPFGLGLKKGRLELVIPDGNRGAASLIRNKKTANTKAVKVDINTLDEVFGTQDLTSIRLIKIDVEGFEGDVFLGAQKLLSAVQPDAILFELNERVEEKLSDETLLKILRNYGYDFFIIPKNIFRMRLIKLSNANESGTLGHDFLAVAKGAKYNEISKLVKAIG